jgi:hypothetical protein
LATWNETRRLTGGRPVNRIKSMVKVIGAEAGRVGECVSVDMNVLNLKDEDTQDRKVWRRAKWGDRLTHAGVE